MQRNKPFRLNKEYNVCIEITLNSEDILTKIIPKTI